MNILFIGLFLTLFATNIFVRLYLNNRQKKMVLKHKNKVPDEFSNKISQKEHQRAAVYTLAKLKLSNIEIIFDGLVLLFWTVLGGLAFIYTYTSSWEFSPITSGLILIGLFSLLNFIIDMPFNWYRTFVLEEKFGFNRTTYATFFLDIIKGLVLATIIGAPILWVILYLMQEAGSLWWLWAFAVYTSFSVILMWLYPTVIAPIFNKFKLLEDETLTTAINELLQKCGFKSKGIYMMDGSKRSKHGNAYFSGFGKNKRIVFFDTLLKSLSNKQILAVLAHELGHFKYKHILKGIVISLLFSFTGLAILGLIYDDLWFFKSFYINTTDNAVALLLFSLTIPVFTFLLSPALSYLSRKNEYEADNFAAKETQAEDLISALVAMYKENASTLTPDSLYSSFYDSHPPAALRIANLNTFLGEKNEKNHT
jgi:STE24 endopeptidase